MNADASDLGKLAVSENKTRRQPVVVADGVVVAVDTDSMLRQRQALLAKVYQKAGVPYCPRPFNVAAVESPTAGPVEVHHHSGVRGNEPIYATARRAGF